MARFLSKSEEHTIIKAIEQAELSTSGEIRVHIEPRCKAPAPEERAKEVFARLGMHNTALKNGVLIYISVKDKNTAIWGDEGIDGAVGQSFWDSELELLLKYFKKGDFAGGLSAVIERIGIKLKKHFPYQQDDINELPDEISYGGDDDDA